MTPVSTVQPLACRPGGAASSPSAEVSCYPACPLAARPLGLTNVPLTWEELLGQR